MHDWTTAQLPDSLIESKIQSIQQKNATTAEITNGISI